MKLLLLEKQKQMASSKSEMSKVLERFNQPQGLSPLAVVRAAQPETSTKSVLQIFQESGQKALSGGIAGAGAMAIQVGRRVVLQRVVVFVKQLNFGDMFVGTVVVGGSPLET